MPPKYKPGDTAYFLENGQYIHQVKITKYSGGFYTVQYLDRPCIFRTRESRLYATREEAEKAEKTISPQKSSVPWWYPD